MWQALIENKLQELSSQVVLADKALDHTRAFVEHLMLWGKVHNLTALRCPEDITTQLVIPSLGFLPVLVPYQKVLDLGAGSGVPGAILAGVCQDKSFVWVERVAKKVAFLRQYKATLALDHSQVLAEDFTQLPVDTDVDVIVSRGSATLSGQLDLTRSWLAQGVVLLSVQTAHSLQQQRDRLAEFKVHELDKSLGLKLVEISQ